MPTEFLLFALLCLLGALLNFKHTRNFVILLICALINAGEAVFWSIHK